MSPQATHRAITESAPGSKEPSPEERRLVTEFGIGFDGRYYRYREYRYDHLSDAISYARQERAKGGKQPVDAQPQWLEPLSPTEDERILMEQFAVAFDGKFFLYDGYRYERCIDAINYARLKKPKIL